MARDERDQSSSVFYNLQHLSRCISPQYQFSYYHREAEFDSCGECWSDIMLSLRAKLAKDEQAEQEILSKLSYRQFQGDLNPSLSIWQPKETPGFFDDDDPASTDAPSDAAAKT